MGFTITGSLSGLGMKSVSSPNIKSGESSGCNALKMTSPVEQKWNSALDFYPPLAPATINEVVLIRRTIYNTKEIINVHVRVSPAYGMCSLNRSQHGGGVTDGHLEHMHVRLYERSHFVEGHSSLVGSALMLRTVPRSYTRTHLPRL